MMIFAGASCSGKTSFIRKLVSASSWSLVSTLDFKVYSYCDSFILDTPCIYRFQIDSFFSKLLSCISMEAATKVAAVLGHTLVLFVNCSDVDRRLVYSIHAFCCKHKFNYIVYDVTGDSLILDSSHCFDVMSKGQLCDYIDWYFSGIDRSTSGSNLSNDSIVFAGITGVGKSSLINKLLGVELIRVSLRNTTNELLKFSAELCGKRYYLYDTYGLENKTKYMFLNLRKLLSNVALVLLVVDVLTYYCAVNKFIIKLLVKYGCRFSILLNKVDLVTSNEVDGCVGFLQTISGLLRGDIVAVSSISFSRERVVGELSPILKYNATHFCDKWLTRLIKCKFKKVLFVQSALDGVMVLVKVFTKKGFVLNNSEVKGIRVLIVNSCCIRLNSLKLVVC